MCPEIYNFHKTLGIGKIQLLRIWVEGIKIYLPLSLSRAVFWELIGTSQNTCPCKQDLDAYFIISSYAIIGAQSLLRVCRRST
jgi:hypothetical protein